MEAGRQPARRKRPAPLHGQFSQAHLPHLPAHEGERSTQDLAALRGGRRASSDSPHHLRRAILLIRSARDQGHRAISTQAKQRGAEGSGGGQAGARGVAARDALSDNQNKNKNKKSNTGQSQNKNKNKLWRSRFSMGAATSNTSAPTVQNRCKYTNVLKCRFNAQTVTTHLSVWCTRKWDRL